MSSFNQFVPNPYTSAPSQLDMMASYQAKLQYEVCKNQLQIDKQQMMLDQRRAFETQMQEVKQQYRAYLDLLSFSIYADTQGKLIFSISDSTDATIAAKPLLNVTSYQSKIYFSGWPEKRYVLEISWEGGKNSSVYFKNAENGISPQIFLKNMKARGVLFLLSGRTEKKAAEALLAYSFQCAETIELPYYRGWNFMSKGRWHFADEKELIMKEVGENAV